MYSRYFTLYMYAFQRYIDSNQVQTTHIETQDSVQSFFEKVLCDSAYTLQQHKQSKGWAYKE